MRKRGRERLDPELAHVAIIGCGLAGLSTAISLEKHGFRNIDIYERDASFSDRKEGYGLTLTYHPSGVLKTLGVLEDVAIADCPSRSHYLFDQHGNILGYFGNAFSKNGGFGQRGNLRVPRQIVRRILLEQLKYTNIHWNHKLIDMKERNPHSGPGSGTSCSGIQLFFEDKQPDVPILADVIVAADGIRSTVLDIWLPNAPPAESLGVRIILGLTKPNEFQHELVNERGFYTLGSGTRLFVMPYSGSKLRENEATRYMWQLSFVDDANCSTRSGKQLQLEALKRTEDWHKPVHTLIETTDPSDIWGTLLQDRNPMKIYEEFRKKNCPRVIFAGDAIHAMSPFKGQGANNCLQDGITIAKWLATASVHSAVAGSMREIVQRTAPIVTSSRQAAKFWHSFNALAVSHKFAGISEDLQKQLRDVLLMYKITAETPNLDQNVRRVFKELGISPDEKLKDKEDNENSSIAYLTKRALAAAASGDLESLRQISWVHPNLIRHIKNTNDDSSCLHTASQNNHTTVVYWLVAESGCNITQKNAHGKAAIDLASVPEVVHLLERLDGSSSC
jgi:2-polyprenyl-6-methoxyphenol hydroxylase-like FAD-dependent oxidoreductase